MKHLFLFCFMFLLMDLIAQESPVEMNDRAFHNYSYSSKSAFHPYFNDKLIYIKEQSLYNKASDKRLQQLLLSSKNDEIIQLVEKAKKNRKQEFIGFAAIPLGIAAAACIRTNSTSVTSLRPIGIACLAASISCIIVSPFACHRKNSHYKEAVKIYNLRF